MVQPETLAQALDESGWTRKKLFDARTGRVCMSGALAEVGFTGGARAMSIDKDPTYFQNIPKVKLLIHALMSTAPEIEGMPTDNLMVELSKVVWTNDRLTEQEAHAWAARADALAAGLPQDDGPDSPYATNTPEEPYS